MLYTFVTVYKGERIFLTHTDYIHESIHPIANLEQQVLPLPFGWGTERWPHQPGHTRTEEQGAQDDGCNLHLFNHSQRDGLPLQTRVEIILKLGLKNIFLLGLLKLVGKTFFFSSASAMLFLTKVKSDSLVHKENHGESYRIPYGVFRLEKTFGPDWDCLIGSGLCKYVHFSFVFALFFWLLENWIPHEGRWYPGLFNQLCQLA